MLVGMVLLASISGVITPPNVSIPKVSGVTSRSTTSSTSPESTPPWIAAPTATTSSGFTPLPGSLPKNSFTASWILGIRVEPPTRITWSISPLLMPASFNALSQGVMDLFTRSSTNCSNLARLRSTFKCFGPSCVAVTKGKFTLVFEELESSILAFSAASLRRCIAIGSLRRSMPSSFLNSSAKKLIMR